MMERRAVLRALSAGVVGSVIGARSGFAAEPPPETRRLRTTTSNIGICTLGPKIVAEALWRAEGFTDVQYQPRPGEGLGLRLAALASGATDIDTTFVSSLIPRIDAGDPIVILGGLHAGCFELFGGERVRAIRDLKGKTVAVSEVGGPDHAFIASMLAYVGLDARSDVQLGQRADRRSRSSGSPTARWMRSSGFPPFRRSYGPGASAMSWSTARRTGRGPSTSAA